MNRSWSDGGLSFICGVSLARVAHNLAAGFTVFTALLVLWPGTVWEDTVGTLFALDLVWLAVWVIHAFVRETDSRPAFTLRRVCSILLLGSSFAALLWQSQEGAIKFVAVGCGFLLRWGLFVAEMMEIRRLDRRKISLPPASARIRLTITWFTGAAIPLLVLLGILPRPLLFAAFLLTAFAQWSVACEQLILARKSLEAHS
jgi:hypothetical protein